MLMASCQRFHANPLTAGRNFLFHKEKKTPDQICIKVFPTYVIMNVTYDNDKTQN